MGANRQASVTFEDVAVRFSAEEWELLEEWQRELHREVTEGTSQLLASLGPPGSPALGALVRLVKEIPEFLFGGPKAGTEPSGAGSEDAAAGSEWMGAGVTTAAPVESCPLRGLERCLEELAVRGSGPHGPPASGSRGPGERQRGEPGGRQSLPGRRSLRGALVPAVPPGSLAETRASGARGTATRPPARPPAAGTATKRPSAEAGPAGAASPPGSGVRPGSCGGVSSPKKRRGGGSPLAPREPPGEAQDPRVDMSRVCAVLAEELERLCRDLRSVRREVWGVRSRLEQLERDRAQEMAALARGRRRLRHAVRRLEGRCRALETRSRHNSLGLPEGAEGAVAFVQTVLPVVPGLLPAPAPLQMESTRRLRGPAALARPLLFSLLRFADKLASLRAAHRHPEPPSWAGARLAIVPAACPPRRQAPLAAGHWAWRAVKPHCGTVTGPSAVLAPARC
ncbi:protein KRBA1 isoform 2-T2 [Theristicus caerulescens]